MNDKERLAKDGALLSTKHCSLTVIAPLLKIASEVHPK